MSVEATLQLEGLVASVYGALVRPGVLLEMLVQVAAPEKGGRTFGAGEASRLGAWNLEAVVALLWVVLALMLMVLVVKGLR